MSQKEVAAQTFTNETGVNGVENGRAVSFERLNDFLGVFGYRLDVRVVPIDAPVPEEAREMVREVRSVALRGSAGRQERIPNKAREGLGADLTRARQRAGLTQAEMGRLLEVSRMRIIAIETGRVYDYRVLRRYMEAVGGELVVEAR